MADCHLWAQFPLPSVLCLIYPQFSASHSGLPQFPYTFWFLSYCHIDKDIFPSHFLFPHYFSSSHLSQVEEKHQCDTVKLNLLSSPRLHGEKLHIQGSHMRIYLDLHHAQWAGTASPGRTWNCSAQSISVLGGGQHLSARMWWLHLEKSASMRCWMFLEQCLPPNLCYSVLLRDFWLDVNIGHQQISLWYHLPSSFRNCSPVAFGSTAHSKAHPTIFVLPYQPQLMML